MIKSILSFILLVSFLVISSSVFSQLPNGWYSLGEYKENISPDEWVNELTRDQFILSVEHIRKLSVIRTKFDLRYQLSMLFDDDVKDMWSIWTRENIGKMVGFVWRGKIIDYPIIRGEIKNGRASIVGSGSKKQLKRIKKEILKEIGS